MTQYVHETLVFRPTKEEFSKPFSEYIAKVLKKNPDVAMFKVIPPEGWRPRRAPIPKLEKLDIHCPIKQLVFGTRGSYRCMLVEQKPLTAHEFREIAEEEGRLPPNKERDKEDKMLERAFWSSLTINPPLYGADTPMSLFDEKLPYGWNLRDLGCLLKQPHIPQVPGVTTPMTYFGMWKSFFAWHVEDADLFSINYLHMGAPKVWYCVSPKDRGKFERMCQSMFPELHAHCHAFLRHKDILLSPSTLKNYGVEYMQAKQEPNEFIVLNTGAYHAGYNLGFNCAEAVNFATQEWLSVGCNVTRCKCDALTEGVRLSMRLTTTMGLRRTTATKEVTRRGLRAAGAGGAAGAPRQAAGSAQAGAPLLRPASAAASAARRLRGQLAAAAAAGAAAGGAPPGAAPSVIIGEDRGGKHFYMVQVDAKPKQRGLLVMRWLKEGRDGLFRPSSDTWEEAAGALVGVRTQWVPGSNGKPGGYRLLTLRSRILDTELVD
ncbi:JmjC domain, hydroxylase-domain-containing protein [Scenedesmus sp. NREL 46B-D3]|nr:JmjC domain, hydroxylase-domain-containing protein [Scenedesmus sp. NREL 46B-D3]